MKLTLWERTLKINWQRFFIARTKTIIFINTRYHPGSTDIVLIAPLRFDMKLSSVSNNIYFYFQRKTEKDFIVRK